jgi:hypothetical protein
MPDVRDNLRKAAKARMGSKSKLVGTPTPPNKRVTSGPGSGSSSRGGKFTPGGADASVGWQNQSEKAARGVKPTNRSGTKTGKIMYPTRRTGPK